MSSGPAKVSLAQARPDLAAQWHPDRNGSLRGPDDVSVGSNLVVWWLGPCNHPWDMPVKQRTGHSRSGCPYCAGKRVFPGDSFTDRHPDLAAEWHATGNHDLRPDTVVAGSSKRVWWQCATCSYEWETTIVHRTREGTGCPACAGMVVVPGRSFADQFPDVASEWHPTRNDGVKSTAVAPFSSKRAWWLCAQCGREWQAAVRGRTIGGKGCSTCSPPGWSQVAIQIGAELATIFAVGDLETAGRLVRREVGWEPDIVIPDRRIALDVDGRYWHGDSHQKTRNSRERDLRKIEAFRNAGWRLVRIREAPLEVLGPDDVLVADLRDTRTVTLAVAEHLVTLLGLATDKLAAYRRLDGLAAAEVADTLIRLYQRGTIATRSLAEVYPDLVPEWHPTKNGVLRPQTVFAGAGRKVWWRCPAAAHDYEASLLNRGQGSGCPYCSGNRAGQGNTLADLHPELAVQWHPTKNNGLVPSQVTPGTGRKAWWRCLAREHDWQASIASRVAGRGCPMCAGYVASPEHNLLLADPILAAQWHPTRNVGLGPSEVTPGSKQVVWWLCSPTGHAWVAAVGARRRGDGCPYCSGHRAGQGNTLAHLHPALAAQWHPTRNVRLDPDQVTPGSNERIWWSCEAAHEWTNTVAARVSGVGCPYCSGRLAGQGNTLADLHPPLATEWHETRNDLRADQVAAVSMQNAWWRCSKKPDHHEWRCSIRSRVDGVGCPYCAGRLATPERNLAILHAHLASEWHPDMNGAIRPEQLLPGSNYKAWWIGACGHSWDAVVGDRVRGTGCPYCVGKRIGQGNTLADVHPDLAAEWHPSRNEHLTPSDVTPGLRHKAWWSCSTCAHEWQASISRRVNRTGCPACSGRAATAEDNLAATHPALATEWHPTKNGDLAPSSTKSGSGKNVWWQCSIDIRHEWQAIVLNRTRKGSGCPYCSGRRPTPERNLGALHPNLAAQWHPTRNDDLRPVDVTTGSGQKAWWLCRRCGHEWRAVIGSRSKGAGCPGCSRRS